MKTIIGYFRKSGPSPELRDAAEQASQVVNETWARIRRDMSDDLRSKGQH